ncbi:C40 family peptidase [Mycolicibacterium llatzerense]|uniref:C40 family peptidase n=2 Tax=Mycolicibacterium llatzerense TaxID=280871 RepID=UPI0036218915
MSIGALVQRVDQALDRAGSLFGNPPEAGGPAALSSSSGLAAAGDMVRTSQAKISTATSGQFAAAYHGFATDAGPALDAAAGSDKHMSDQLTAAANADRSGKASSGSVRQGAATDTTALAPFTGTHSGKLAMLQALRTRVAQQQQLITAAKARDAQLVAMARSIMYSRRSGGGGMPMGGMPFGGGSGGGGLGGGSGGGGLSGLSGLSSLAGLGKRDPRTTLASNVDFGGGRYANVPNEPGQAAAEAALSKRGRPYVWGAKGPSVFDCSGLTQWAWGKAGVRLGGDTYSQIHDGVPVPPGQVRAGDLIFPNSSFGEGGKGGPGHVMLAISPTECVHAPQTGDVVRVAPMPHGYVARRPVRTTLT